MLHRKNLLTLPVRSPASVRERGDIAAWLRFRSVRRACFKSQLEAAAYLKVDDSTVARWEARRTSVPGWALMALEDVAEERNVTIAGVVRRAA